MSAPRVARWKPLARILGLLALVEVASVALIVVEAERLEGRGSAYAAILEAYRKDPAGFRGWSTRLLIEGARGTSLAHMDASTPAVVTELGPALRVVTTLRGRLENVDGVARDVDLEYREYYHPHGLDLVNAECAAQGDACAARRHLAAEIERRLLSRLHTVGAAELLLEGGECTAVGDTDVERRQTHACAYPLGIVITVRRYPETATRERLRLYRAR